MKILVAVKRVVDAKIKVRPLPDHSGVDVKLAKMAMNPFDEIAIEKAVTLREAGVADEVVAVTVGPLKAVRVRCRTFFLNGCRAQGPRLRFSRVPSFPRR